MCCFSIFIYPTGRIRVCKIRFVSTGENRAKTLAGVQEMRCYIWDKLHATDDITSVPSCWMTSVLMCPPFKGGMSLQSIKRP